MVWDLTTMQARLSPARIESVLTAVARVRKGRSLTIKQFLQLLGLMAAVSNVIPLGLLYMRPLEWWLRTKQFSPRGNPFHTSRSCGPGAGSSLLPHNASNGCVPHRLGSGHGRPPCPWSVERPPSHLAHHCLEMLAVFQALKHFLPDLRDRHVLVRTDSTAVVYHINHQGGLRSRPLYKLAHQILVWSQDKLLSLRAVYIPGHLNLGADILLRQGPRPGEWMLHPEVVKQIWRVYFARTAHAFKLPGLYVTPPVTSRFSIGLYAQVFQSVVTLEVFP
ncbi:hypothetical protein H4Q32_030891 [Labeo rohita]|uniref:Reverse transcriptase RNase H-like domain-containing protein n=1 Tax=Labeo rohita TaxID=84645 RepID=A0ABQ8L1Y8_LABRO|nr:hypothetical protein H4Q32_030891 [Labeo rohita]